MSKLLNGLKDVSFGTSQDRAEPAEIWKARKFIHDNFDGDLSLTKVAKSVNISANHFSEKFKQVTGTNYVVYVVCLRAEHARRLVQQSDRRISEIAFAVGFQSLSQFNRVFKRLYGKSPRTFRAVKHAKTRAGKNRPVLLPKKCIVT